MNLKQKGIRVRLIVDNVLDAGTVTTISADRLRVLARAANDNLHQVILIVQSEAAAKAIGDLNGATTKKGSQMPAEFYRWSREETLELLNRLENKEELLKKRLGDGLKDLEAEALERAAIPDQYGLWRPRDTLRYIMTGDPPEAPLPGRFEISFLLKNFKTKFEKKDILKDSSSFEGKPNAESNAESNAASNAEAMGGRGTALTQPVWVRQLKQDWPTKSQP